LVRVVAFILTWCDVCVTHLGQMRDGMR
jgi:hypothetical protein